MKLCCPDLHAMVIIYNDSLQCCQNYINFREALLKTDTITLDSTGEYIVTSVNHVSDDETSNSSCNSHDETYNDYDDRDNKITESWD